MVGCSGTFPPKITQMPDNRFAITVTGGIGDYAAELTRAWVEAAGKQCRNYDIVSQQFINNPNGVNSMTGVIKCK